MDVMDFTQIDEDVHLRNLQPDGLVMDDDRKRIHILDSRGYTYIGSDDSAEFARTRSADKQVKYDDLCKKIGEPFP